jgi:hypothetical protein
MWDKPAPRDPKFIPQKCLLVALGIVGVPVAAIAALVSYLF